MNPNEAQGEPNRLADRLIEVDNATAPPGATEVIDPMFERLLEDERRFEERLRRIAVGSWATTLASLVALVATFAFSGDLRLNPHAQLRDVLAMLLVPIGIVALLAAIVTSTTWLFRSRTPTLRAIARRLESMERRLAADR